MNNDQRFVFRIFNIPPDMTKDALLKIIMNFGPVCNLWLSTDYNGACVGFAFIECCTEDDMNFLRNKLNGYILNGTLLYTMPV